MTVTPEPTIARDFVLNINTGTVTTPTWTPISGITNIAPGNDSTKTDDSDFDSNGRARSTVVERSDTLQVDLNYKEDPSTGARDPGQQALLDASKLIGTAAKKQFQYLTPGGTQYAFTASIDMNLPGGGKTDLATTSLTLTIDGDITETPAP
ncbi:MAG TPA: hypothetical protein VFV01_47750 [Spirillospora sp.]|nr:hypothetical protein [Spirillospora sp.]